MKSHEGNGRDGRPGSRVAWADPGQFPGKG
jgi:hypothetical protein